MKKWLIKTSCVLLCFLFAGLVACNNSPNLYQKGIEITTTMGEMVNSETYVEMMGVPSNSNIDLIKAKDYDTPICVYKISSPSFDAFVQNLNLDKTKLDELSENLKEQIENKYSFSTIINLLNQEVFNIYGTDALVLSSSFVANKVFDGKISSSSMYLYTFETGKAIAVVFTPFGENKFKASGHFVFTEDISSLSKAREIFEPFGCTVENAN